MAQFGTLWTRGLDELMEVWEVVVQVLDGMGDCEVGFDGWESVLVYHCLGN